MKHNKVSNSYFLIPYIFGILKSLIYLYEQFSSAIILQYFLYLLVIFFMNLLLFHFNLIGGADFKVILLIFLIYSPLNKQGIIELNDGIQFLLIFTFYFYLIPSCNLIKNLFFKNRISELHINKLKKQELIKLFLFLYPKELSKIKSEDQILIDFKKCKLIFKILSNNQLYFLILPNFHILPVILVCFLLTLLL
jgi:hypothetical protein